jgi:hypothetical protein
MANLSDAIGTHGGYLAYETITATASSALATTTIKPTGANIPAQSALVTNNDSTIVVRLRFGAVTATTTTGHALAPRDSVLLHGTELLRGLRMIGESGSPLVGVTTFA